MRDIKYKRKNKKALHYANGSGDVIAQQYQFSHTTNVSNLRNKSIFSYNLTNKKEHIKNI